MLAGVIWGGAVVTVAQPALSGQERAMMIEAARTDLYAQLGRQVKGLQIDDQTLVADNALESSDRSAATDAWLRGVEIGEPEFAGDICFVPGSITLDQVVQNLKSWRRTDASGREISYENIKRHTEFVTIHAVGTGSRATPQAPVSSAGAGSGPQMANDGLREALASMEGPGQQKLGALEASRIDALANLARQIKGVQINDQSFVQNMALDGRWTDSATSALVKGARVVRYKAMGPDLVSCVMEIDLLQVVENVQRSSTEFANGRVIERERVHRYNPGLTTIRATGFGAIGDGRATSGVPMGRIIGTVE
ncbi:MAG: hypothetical protein SynsKO_28720 [Synoicihabitans sp.]